MIQSVSVHELILFYCFSFFQWNVLRFLQGFSLPLVSCFFSLCLIFIFVFFFGMIFCSVVANVH